MHLIQVLASGVSGAGNGTATVYRHGTTTRASTYADFDGLTANQTTADHSLDSNGGVVLYVDEIVDVVVKNSSGIAVRTFTAGEKASAIQYAGNSFLGINPVTGASAAGQPVNLEDALDTIYTSFGARDSKVTFGGSDRLLYQVLSGLNLVVNVKDPLYGALGDNSTDDTSAIQAALTAAGAQTYDGLVFFPPGVYKISSALTVPAGVSIMGCGAKSTVIANHHATANTMVIDGDPLTNDFRMRFISGIAFAAGVVNTGNCIRVVDAALIIEKCSFGIYDATLGSQGDLIAGPGDATPDGKIIIRDCNFFVGATGKSAIADLDSITLSVRDSHFYVNVATYTGTVIDSSSTVMDIDGCIFNASTAAFGAVTYIDAQGTTSVRGCSFSNGGGATTTAFQYTSGKFFESGNTVGTTVTLYGSGFIVAANLDDCTLNTRERRQTTASCPSTTAVAVDATNYGTVYVTTSGGAGARTIQLADCPSGSRFYIFVVNAGSGAHTFNVMGLASGYTVFPTSASLAVGSVVGYVCESVWLGSDAQWSAVGHQVPFP